MTNLNEQVHNYTESIEEAINGTQTNGGVKKMIKKVAKVFKWTAIGASSLVILVVSLLLWDISNDTPQEKAKYMGKQESVVTAQEVKTEKVSPQVKAVTSINLEEATLRQTLSQEYPMANANELDVKWNKAGNN